MNKFPEISMFSRVVSTLINAVCIGTLSNQCLGFWGQMTLNGKCLKTLPISFEGTWIHGSLPNMVKIGRREVDNPVQKSSEPPLCPTGPKETKISRTLSAPDLCMFTKFGQYRLRLPELLQQDFLERPNITTTSYSNWHQTTAVVNQA